LRMYHHKAKILQSDWHRTRALQCEERAQEATDAAVKRGWEEVAIEWHLLATSTANQEMSQIDFVLE
jgi:hypothetical protein